MAKTKTHEKRGNAELRSEPPLSNWYALQDALRSCGEAFATKLLEAERRGQARERFMKRIHSRLNRLRAQREREALRSDAKERMAS